MLHDMEPWDKVLPIKYIKWCKKSLKIIILIYLSELQLDSFPAKHQYDCMCGIY